jgi:branched-chain amino acid transport system permease protein
VLNKLSKEWVCGSIPCIAIGLFLLVMPGFLDVSYVSLLTKVLIFGLLAMSLDIIYGYTGLWSFGHASLFGVGAYVTGILIKNYAITSFWLAAPAGVLAAVFVSAVFGYLALRVKGLHFLIVTLGLGQLTYCVAIKWSPVTGGFNGLIGIPYPNLGFPFSFSSLSFYYFTLVIVAICSFLLFLVVKSPFGSSLKGIRDAELRMRCLGYNTWLHKYLAFIISGLFAGVAGVLYLYFNGLISPGDIGVGASGNVMLMVMLGGSGTLWGPAIGTTVFLTFAYFVSLFMPERWPLFLGIGFIAAVMFLTGGIWPYLARLWPQRGNS